MHAPGAAPAADGQLRLVWRQPAESPVEAIEARRALRLADDDTYALLDRRRRRAQIAARHALDREPDR